MLFVDHCAGEMLGEQQAFQVERTTYNGRPKEIANESLQASRIFLLQPARAGGNLLQRTRRQ
jgi:hypothetical protein